MQYLLAVQFRSADHAVEHYARMFDKATAGRPNEIAGHAWATTCQRCPSDRWQPRWNRRLRTWEARCVSCNSRWHGESVALPKMSGVSSGDARDHELARLASLHLMISRLPTWERRALYSFVLYPDAGSRYEKVAEEFRERWPWHDHALEITRACEGAYAKISESERHPIGGGKLAGGSSRQRQRDWTFYRVRLLVAAGRQRLEASLRAAHMLEEEEESGAESST